MGIIKSWLTPAHLHVEYALFPEGVYNMADEIDFANDLIDIEVSHAINRMRQQANQVSEGSKTCVECGDPIPEARKKLGFKLCVPCAQEAERHKHLFAD